MALQDLKRKPFSVFFPEILQLNMQEMERCILQQRFFHMSSIFWGFIRVQKGKFVMNTQEPV